MSEQREDVNVLFEDLTNTIFTSVFLSKPHLQIEGAVALHVVS